MKVIRFYIEEKLISPEYTENYLGRKTFSFSDVDVKVLSYIAILRKYGFSIAEIHKIIESKDNSSAIINDVCSRKNKTIQEEAKMLSVLLQLNDGKDYTLEEIIDDSESYDGDKLAQIKGRLGDISYGLVNGTVGSLIYYDDTNKFFEEYYDDIWEVVQEWSEQGVEPLEALKRNCDEVEIIMGTDNFKCWVVWMVYEEIAYLFGEALDEINSEEQVSA